MAGGANRTKLSLSDQIHNRQHQKGFVGRLISGQCRPAVTVFISPQAGKAFEVSGKRHSISRRSSGCCICDQRQL